MPEWSGLPESEISHWMREYIAVTHEDLFSKNGKSKEHRILRVLLAISKSPKTTKHLYAIPNIARFYGYGICQNLSILFSGSSYGLHLLRPPNGRSGTAVDYKVVAGAELQDGRADMGVAHILNSTWKQGVRVELGFSIRGRV